MKFVHNETAKLGLSVFTETKTRLDIKFSWQWMIASLTSLTSWIIHCQLNLISSLVLVSVNTDSPWSCKRVAQNLATKQQTIFLNFCIVI